MRAMGQSVDLMGVLSGETAGLKHCRSMSFVTFRLSMDTETDDRDSRGLGLGFEST